MANTLKFGNGQWATKVGSTLAYNDEGGNFKPLPFNFTRSTSATRVNKDGLIEMITNNKPRIDFLNDSNGALLLEPQRSNLALYSNDLSNAAWDKTLSTITSNAAISPDGTLNANKIVETTDNNLHRAGQGSISVTSGQIYTFSFYAKAGERNELELQRINTSGTVFNSINVTNADLTLGTLSVGSNVTSSSINSVGDGWYRISLSLTAIATGSGGLNIGMQKDGNVSYLGDGTSGVYIYGFQAEQGSYATSYIPTQGATATRVAETCSDAGNDQVINSTEGVFYLNVASNGLHPSFDIITLSDGTSDNRVLFDYTNIDNQIETFVRIGGVSYGVSSFITEDEDFIKVAIKWKVNDCSIYVNGSKIYSNLSIPTFPANTLDRLNFDIGTGSNIFYGKCKDLRVYNTALTDAELISLTS
jgi:hypothetical protein